MKKPLLLSLVVIMSSLLFAACIGPSKPANQDLKLTGQTNVDESTFNQQVTQPGDTPMIDQPTAPVTATQAVTQAVLKTSKGDITLKLYPDQAPTTVANFATKSTNGFYNGLTFHRVESWVIQGGDPSGNGTGGGKMPTELNQIPFKEGSLGVARGGDIKVSNDAQFFICTTDCSWLTGQYTNFGEVIEGMEVATQIEVGDKILGIEVSE